MTEWSVSVSEDVDKSVRAFLAQQGSDAEHLSQFVEEAVRDKLFAETVRTVKARNAHLDQQAIMDIVEEAVGWAREDRH